MPEKSDVAILLTPQVESDDMFPFPDLQMTARFEFPVLITFSVNLLSKCWKIMNIYY